MDYVVLRYYGQSWYKQNNMISLDETFLYIINMIVVKLVQVYDSIRYNMSWDGLPHYSDQFYYLRILTYKP